jgi:hypothetical protein
MRYLLPTLTLTVTLDVDDQARQVPGEFFVGDGCPSFATSAGVFNTFFDNNLRATGMSPPSFVALDYITH